jgi:hypothetical protein
MSLEPWEFKLPVTDPDCDAPDGATIEHEEHGWITRCRDVWRPATDAEIHREGGTTFTYG